MLLQSPTKQRQRRLNPPGVNSRQDYVMAKAGCFFQPPPPPPHPCSSFFLLPPSLDSLLPRLARAMLEGADRSHHNTTRTHAHTQSVHPTPMHGDDPCCCKVGMKREKKTRPWIITIVIIINEIKIHKKMDEASSKTSRENGARSCDVMHHAWRKHVASFTPVVR